MMRIIITCGSTKFSSNGTSLQHSQLPVKAINDPHDFLAQTSGRRRLSVSLCQHRDIRPFFCVSSQLRNQFFNLRIIYLFQRFFDRQRHWRIINVLRSKAEVDKLLVFFHSAQLVKLFLNEIFYSFNVVVCNTLYFLNASGIGFREVLVDSTKRCKTCMIKACQLR